MINKAYKFLIYPNQAPANLINKTIGCAPCDLVIQGVYGNIPDNLKDYTK